jgi:hypothetical protein
MFAEVVAVYFKTLFLHLLRTMKKKKETIKDKWSLYWVLEMQDPNYEQEC